MIVDDSVARTARLHQSDDALVWAEEFMAVIENPDFSGVDCGFMIGWFANAIETSKSLHRSTDVFFNLTPDQLVNRIFAVLEDRDPESDPGDLVIEVQDDMPLVTVSNTKCRGYGKDLLSALSATLCSILDEETVKR